MYGKTALLLQARRCQTVDWSWIQWLD